VDKKDPFVGAVDQRDPLVDSECADKRDLLDDLEHLNCSSDRFGAADVVQKEVNSRAWCDPSHGAPTMDAAHKTCSILQENESEGA